MRVFESHCVGCTSLGLHCQGSACKNSRPVETVVCDKCRDSGPIYDFEGQELCGDCISKLFDKELEDIIAEEDVEEIKI